MSLSFEKLIPKQALKSYFFFMELLLLIVKSRAVARQSWLLFQQYNNAVVLGRQSGRVATCLTTYHGETHH
jgi:hypothetical protein